MKYTVKVKINAPVQDVWNYFTDTSKLKEWQPGLQSVETFEGKEGMPGAKSNMVFVENGREMKMVETVLERKDYSIFKSVYEAKGVWNLNEIKLTSLDRNTTEVENYTEFKFSGFMKIIGLLFGSTFKSQSQKYLDLLKAGVEKA